MAEALIRDYMVAHPYTIKFDETASAAEKVMSAHRIRHLPVINTRKIVGVVSERDIAVARMVHAGQPFDGSVLVKDVCSLNPYVVTQTTTVRQVAKSMAKLRSDVTIVVENDVPIGIFTCTDACRLLSELFEADKKSSGIWASLFGK